VTDTSKTIYFQLINYPIAKINALVMKHFDIKISIPIFLFFFLANSSFAQPLEVQDATTPPLTPDALIKNIFLGDGIEVVDVQFEGDPRQVGFFNNGEDEMGIDRGIIMSTGRAATQGSAYGANSTGGDFASNDLGGSVQDPDLASIGNGSINDAVIFTIVFRPAADTLRFNYVFASEEYPEWSCSQFNDVFGFFISGPGINGPFNNNGENIAIIPGTNQPVSINNIHPDDGPACPPAFSNFYNDNNATALQPVYDGYLDVFTAQAIVTPCEEYTIKLMISDVGDHIFDSGVFLEAKSFGTGTLEVEAATAAVDGSVAEGCGEGLLTFSLEFAPENDFVIDYSIIGTAENGVDYETIPTNLTIEKGETEVVVPIIGIEDALNEGFETIGIDVQRDVCTRDTIWLFIRDNELISPILPPDTLMCVADTIGLDGSIPINIPPPPTFTMDTDLLLEDAFGSTSGVTTSQIVVAGVQPPYLGQDVIRSVCINIDHRFVDDLDIFLVSPGGQFLELTSDNGANCDDYVNTCFSPNAIQPITFWTGNTCGPGESPPFTGEFQPEGTWTDLWDGENPTNGVWELIVIDDSQGFSGILLDWTITFEPVYKIFYEWSPATDISCTDCPQPNIYPSKTTTYTVTASDTYGCEVTDSITIEFFSQLPAPTVSCSNVTNTNMTFDWTSVPGAISYQVNVNGNGWIDPTDNLSHTINNLTPSDTIIFEVVAFDGCKSVIDTAICWTPDCDAPLGVLENFTNAACNVGGSITVSASGGSGSGYTFSLGNETNSTGIFQDLAAGDYSVTISDSFGCANIVQASIVAPGSITLSEVIVNEISCDEGADGVITVIASGGEAPYTFNWNNISNDSIYIDLDAGTYNLTVTDAVNCEATISIELTNPDPINIDISSTPANCFGLNDGSATVSPSGGQGPPYNYLWDANANDQTTATATNLTSGSYFVTVSDNNGCQSIALVAVGQPTLLNTSIAGVDIDCFGAQNGSIDLSVTGGTPGYSYDWTPILTGPNPTNLNGGVYSVTVTDTNGCTAENGIQLDEPDSLSVILSVTDVTCFGGNDGGLICQAVGGAGNYIFDWSDGVSGSNQLSPISSGSYCVTVTDENGCTKVACADVNQPDELILSTTFNNAGCNGGSDGSIDLTIAGGVTPFNILWSNMEVTEDLNNLDAGIYTVEVTDGNGCQATTTVEITDIAAINLSIDGEDILCTGDNTGSINLTPTGGTGIFNFTWSGPNGFTSPLEDNINLFSGDYTVTVSDSEGCSASIDITLTEPAEAVSALIGQTSTICFNASNGTATVAASGGIQPYSYIWSNGQTAETANNLAAGNYTVTVTDLNGCEAIQGVNIQQQFALSLELSQTGASCFNGNDGQANIDLILLGLNPVDPNDVSIDWDGSTQNTTNVTDLLGGQTYTVTITDALGCTAENSITIDNPPAIGSSILETVDVKCYNGVDGSATVSGDGGTEPYSYLWSPNAGGQITATAIDLPAETFTITVTDNNGCSTTTQLTLNEPAQLQVDFNNDDILCFGQPTGGSTASASFGTEPYIYEWESGIVGATDSELPPGFSMVTVTDAEGCQIQDSTFIRQPEMPLTSTFDVDEVSCPGLRDGTIMVFAAGGTPAYTYSLDGVEYNGASTLVALESGFYNVFIKDGNGCIAETGEIFIDEPDPLILDLGSDTTITFGESLQLFPTIQNADLNTLSYFWWANRNNAIIDDSVSRAPIVMVEEQTTFTLSITDENGCKAEDRITVFIEKERFVLVPTGFTPNADGANDRLLVHGKSDIVKEILLFQVFDRWGEMVFEAENFDINDVNVGWDGQFKNEDMQAGVYIWNLQVEYIDGIIENMQGHTTLIR
jgi:gliding motility-associated-like protein